MNEQDQVVLNLQHQAMFLTLEQFEMQIAETEHFTPDIAIRNGLTYISRVNQENEVSLQIAKNSKKDDEAASLNKEIEKFNTILQEAGRGSFISLKTHLLAVGRFQLQLADAVKTKSKEESDKLEKMGKAYLKMVEAIPDNGDPVSIQE